MQVEILIVLFMEIILLQVSPSAAQSAADLSAMVGGPGAAAVGTGGAPPPAPIAVLEEPGFMTKLMWRLKKCVWKMVWILRVTLNPFGGALFSFPPNLDYRTYKTLGICDVGVGGLAAGMLGKR